MTPAWTPTREEYYADPAVGSSALRDFMASPLTFYDYYVGKTREKKTTKEMDKGSLADLMLTEPEQVHRLFKVTDLERKDTKDWKKEEAAAGGRKLVKRPVWEAAEAIARAVRANPLALALLSGQQQLCHRWEDVSGVTCRMRVDSLTETQVGWANVDFKVWTSVSPVKNWRTGEWDWRDAERRAWNQGVHYQFALYERGLVDLGLDEVLWVLLIAPQDEPHDEIVPVQLSVEHAWRARAEVDAALTELGRLLAHPDHANRELWLPSYSRQITKLSVPPWELRKEQ